EPAAGAGGRLSEPLLRVPLPPLAFLTLLLEVLAGASASPGCVVPCATSTFELEVVCGAFCPCVTVASAIRLMHVTDPRIRNDIVGPSCNCRSTTALNPRGAVFSSVVSAKGHVWTAPGWQELSSCCSHWSVRPCVRPFSAALMTAGHNRGSGPNQKRAFD